MNYELLKAISPGKDFCIKDIFPQKYTHTKKHPVIHTSYFHHLSPLHLPLPAKKKSKLFLQTTDTLNKVAGKTP